MLADLTGLSQKAIDLIIGNSSSTNADSDGKSGDKRKALTDNEWVAIARLLLQGVTQKEIAEKFGVAQATVSEWWAKFRDTVLSLYSADHLLKKTYSRKLLASLVIHAMLF